MTAEGRRSAEHATRALSIMPGLTAHRADVVFGIAGSLHSGDVRAAKLTTVPHATVSPPTVTAGSGCPLSVGEAGDGRVSPSFPSQGSSDIMGIPAMPGQDDPKADIRHLGGRESKMANKCYCILCYFHIFIAP